MYNIKILVKGAVMQAYLVAALSKEIYNLAVVYKACEQ
jgi:hypothetical protein